MNVFDIVKIDREWVAESVNFSHGSIKKRRHICENPSLETLKSGIYSSWIMNHNLLCMFEYALNQDPKQLKQNVDTAMTAKLPLFQHELSFRRPSTPQNPYDVGSIADYFFAEIFCLFTILHSKEEIVPICEKTTYGRYAGKPKLNHHQAIVCRILRAFFLGDESWLSDEIDSLKDEPVARDLHTPFRIPKSNWHPLLYSLFYGDRDSFVKAAKPVAKWFYKYVTTRCVNEKGYVFPGALINLVLLLMIKIANAYRGYNVTIDDPFVPMDLINPS